MAGKYIESDTFLMPLIPRSDRKAQLVKETIKRHSGRERTRERVMERVSDGERHTGRRRGQGLHTTKDWKRKRLKHKNLADITNKRKEAVMVGKGSCNIHIGIHFHKHSRLWNVIIYPARHSTPPTAIHTTPSGGGSKGLKVA